MSAKQNSFAKAVLEWFDVHGRRHLPWQTDKTAYRVWLSEIMLQQTQVATVIPYYHCFLKNFPSMMDLANAELDRVLQQWQGLGYYARARNLHRTARIICDEYQGEFPQTMEAVLALPGIGRSTAASILTFACNQSWPILDGNVKRVLSRCFQVSGWNGQSATLKKLWQLSETVTPKQRTDAFNQAMMDLGSMVCLKAKPLCQQCPLMSHCQSYQQQTQHLYPQKKPVKVKPQKQTLMLLHRYQDRVLLHRRPPVGIWGGLWSLPEVADVDEISVWQARYLSARPAALSAGNLSINEQVMQHQFTHFNLHISVAMMELDHLPAKIADGCDLQFVAFEHLADYGLPTPVREILHRFANS